MKSFDVDFFRHKDDASNQFMSNSRYFRVNEDRIVIHNSWYSFTFDDIYGWIVSHEHIQ